MQNLNLREHESSSYAPRTKENCKLSDLTIAIAYDFTTHGELLTRKEAGKKYVAINKDMGFSNVVNFILEKLGNSLIKHSLNINIAGNGIYTLNKFNVNQNIANLIVYGLLIELSKEIEIKCIMSGGQTGIDTAGLVSGIKLGIPVYGLYPKGYKRRNAKGQDFNSTKK